MNYPMIRSILGFILGVEALFMAPALGIALFRGESRAALGFGAAMLLMALVCLLMVRKRPTRRDYYTREGLVTVGLGWLLLSAFGALPFCLSGAILSPVDAFFETVSGFTTTGASVLSDIEALPMSLLYWRSFTHWLGGMGVLVFFLAINPLKGDSGASLHLLRAESPGIRVSKMVPRMRRNSLILYAIYVALTILMFVLLVFDMPVFDALTTAFATAGTGGFAIKNDSLVSYSLYSQIVVTVFMMLFGVNFSIYYLMLLRRFRSAARNSEFWAYWAFFAGATVVIALNTLSLHGGLGLSLHQASFTVASIMSTTGFMISDFDLWPELSKTIILLLMFVGGCAGSTGGGLKVVRVVLLGKIVQRGVRLTLRPNEVKSIRLDGEAQERTMIDACGVYLLTFFLLMAGFTLLLSLEGLDFTSTFSAVVTCMNNVGPGFNAVGPTMNFSVFSPFGKILLSLAMLFGRLELYPMLVLFVPRTWKK